MAHKFENARALLTALDNPGRPADISSLREITPRVPVYDFDQISKSVYQYLNQFAELLASRIPVVVSGESFDTTNYYHQPEGQMMVFSLKPADQDNPIPLPSRAVSRLGILDMYNTVNLTNHELAKIILEKRPTSQGHIIDAYIKSHGLTPDSITRSIAGSTPIVGHLDGRIDRDYTTIKLSPLPDETTQNFVDRINQALETTAAGIVVKSEIINRQARQKLALAA